MGFKNYLTERHAEKATRRVFLKILFNSLTKAPKISYWGFYATEVTMLIFGEFFILALGISEIHHFGSQLVSFQLYNCNLVYPRPRPVWVELVWTLIWHLYRLLRDLFLRELSYLDLSFLAFLGRHQKSFEKYRMDWIHFRFHLNLNKKLSLVFFNREPSDVFVLPCSFKHLCPHSSYKALFSSSNKISFA